MKTISLYTVVFAISIFAIKAQKNHSAILNPIDKVPLILESKTILDSAFVVDEVTATFQTISSSIKVRLMLPLEEEMASQMYAIDTPLSEAALEQVEYRTFINAMDFTEVWHGLSQRRSGLIIDADLKSNDKLFIQFRIKGKKELIQQDVIIRSAILPTISFYCPIKPGFAKDAKLNAKAHRKGTLSFNHFSTLTDDGLVLDAGWGVEAVITGPKTIYDSSLLFRLFDLGNEVEQGWQSTGHYLSVNNLGSNDHYILQLKYLGMDEIRSYNITTKPYWYETDFFKIVVSGLMVMLILAILYAAYKRKIKREKAERYNIENQLASIQGRLNPHFIYNALGSIQDLISKNLVQDARKYIDRFSAMMRGTLENSEKLFIPLSEEIKMLDNYLSLERLRFGFAYNIKIDEELDVHSIDFPPMLLQPSVENAVKHGVWKLGETGVIKITFSNSEDGFVITVFNTGQNDIAKSIIEGYGIKLTRSRIDNLRKIFKHSTIDFSVSFKEDGYEAKFIFSNYT